MKRLVDASLLSDLWFFRIAAEHSSIRKASSDLAITQSAVTQRIQRLESRLGVALFERRGRGLQLSADGAELLKDVQAGFDLVAAGLSRTRANVASQSLSINCAPSFALLWLGPRLRRFSATVAPVNVTLVADMQPVDDAQMLQGSTDVVIRYGPEPPEGVSIAFEFPEFLTPVAERGLLAEIDTSPSSTPIPLLHDAQPWLGARRRTAEWDLWCGAHGPLWDRPNQDNFFNVAQIAYNSAAAGGGVAIGRSMLVAPYLASGQLVRVSETAPVGGLHYYVSTHSKAADAATTAFVAWLHSEMTEARKAIDYLS